MSLRQARATFADPPREFGLIPLWFWNDDLQEEVLLEQLHAFYEAGFGGVAPHPRLGLSRRVGYLTDEYFRLLRLVVTEAARLGMKIILYDEGSYPSGAANGAVVAENPQYASQCISLWEREVDGPFRGYWRPNTGRALLDRHVCTVLGRVRDDGGIDADSVRVLDALPHDIVHIEVPAGRWQAMSVWQTHSGGIIRGVLAEEESGHATAPPAADILNPAAVARFLALTHDQYYKHLREFFGTTIISLFTDEPSILGKGPHRTEAPQPYTTGLVDWLADRWRGRWRVQSCTDSARCGAALPHQWGEDPRAWLPALWRDYGPETAAFRRDYAAAVQQRLEEVFYAAQSEWCAAHGIALTGHPKWSNEMSVLRFFQYPGQDMVHRYIEPASTSAVEGAHSVAAKAATSGARLQGARRILTEVCGAYGWRLTLDETKWLFDWHLVRGNNLLCPHAVYYSIRDRRAWESEPDLGVHNVWWQDFHHLAGYARRLSWLLSDGQQVCDVAILGEGNDLPWRAAKQLYQDQIDFLYLDDAAVAAATVNAGCLEVSEQRYRVVILEGDPVLSDESRANLDCFQESGGQLIVYQEDQDLPAKLDTLMTGQSRTNGARCGAALICHIDRDLRLTPHHPDLRFLHYRKGGLDYYLLVNEGETEIAGRLRLAVAGEIAAWDPLSGGQRPIQAAAAGDGLRVALDLGRRESLVLAVDTRVPFVPPPVLPMLTEERIPLDLRWEVRDLAGAAVAVPAPGDWARQPGYELLSGTLRYRTELTLPAPATEAWLDLGQVGDSAAVFLDGRPVGVRMWAPYRVCLGRGLAPRAYRLEVRVTNSMANEYEGSQRPSGLLGPVTLIAVN